METSLKLVVNPAYIPLIDSNKRFLVLRGGAGCFVAGTKVLTEHGQKPIEDIGIGEKVCSHSFIKQKNEFRTVTATHKKTAECVKIRLKNGESIECTLDHKFFDGESFVEISELLNSWKKKNFGK